MKRQINPDEIKNILIIRKHNQIGDMMVSVPMFYALKKHFPESKITLLASPTNYPIPFFHINPFLDEVIIYDKSSIKKQIEIIRYLRSKDFQIGIVPSTIRLSFTSHLVNFLSSIKLRVGVNSIDREKNPARFLLNIKKDFFWKERKTHQIIRNLEVVEQIKCNINLSEALQINFNQTEENQKVKNELIQYFGGEKILVGIHAGAGKKENIWKTENFIQIIMALKAKFDCNFIISSGSTDELIETKITHVLKQKGIKYYLCRNLPITKLASYINQCDLFISNDTGVMHIAGWTEVNLISLFGKTKAFEWAPIQKNKFSIQSKTSDINDIQVNDVLQLSIKLLNQRVHEKINLNK